MASFSASGTPVPFSSFSVGTSYQPGSAFPSRRIIRSIPNSYPHAEDLEAWANEIGLTLGPLIPSMEARIDVLKLLWQYRHLNSEDLSDLPPTDLVVHRVQLQPGTRPSSKPQRRMAAHKEWWLRKLVQEGLEGGVYEYCEAANGRFSPWNAQAVMVDKSDDPKPTDEMRMTFDYSRVDEVMPGTYIELSSKVHDHLSDPRHGVLMSADMKHAYSTISLHPDDRHIFAFTISGIGQLQPTRMQQGSMSAGFTLTEVVYKALGFIPPPSPEPSLLHSDNPSTPPPLSTYMDDIFGGFRTFDDMFKFLRDHFFPRIEWARLKLSFKKLKLFMDRIKALGVVHVVGGLVYIVSERIEKIAKWPTPTNPTEVRAFLGVVGITRRWVKNFTEIARPLARLTGKAEWKWTAGEELSFEILKVKCSVHTSMNGIDLTLAFHFYCDASGYAAGLAITQVQMKHLKNLKLTPEDGSEEVPIIYDSFAFNKTQKKYPTYKKELCAIVKFTIKYDYLCKHPNNTTIIHTDHRPLTHFLPSDSHEGIYGHWADQLRRLNVIISYIPGPRNKVADGLSRTLFRSEDCDTDGKIEEALAKLRSLGPSWIWKDGKDGYQFFLDSLNKSDLEEVITKGTIQGCNVFALEINPHTGMEKASWKEAYWSSEWFGDIYRFLEEGILPRNSKGIVAKSYDYRISPDTDILWVHRNKGGMFLPCIPEGKVLSVLRKVHDDDGHWARTTTLAKLRDMAYWPNQSRDVERYIEGCLACARHGPATRSQPLNPIHVFRPFQLAGMDFIGALPRTSKGNSFVLHFMDYFSRFSVAIPTSTANVEDVIPALEYVFNAYQKPVEIYCDGGQHFHNEELKGWLKNQGVKLTLSPSGSSQSTGLIEGGNKFLEGILRKDSNKEWDLILEQSTNRLNSRIIGHLGLSPASILMGPRPPVFAVDSTLLSLPNLPHPEEILHQLNQPLIHREIVRVYSMYRAQVYDHIRQLSQDQKEREAERFNKGITKRIVHEIGSLVMLYQKKHTKLAPRWRGPFRIQGYGGTHQLSFVLVQLNGRKIRGTFHGNHLKIFKPRTGYLSDPSREEDLLLFQTIRVPKSKKKR